MRSIFGALLITIGLFVSAAVGQVTGRVEKIGYEGSYRPGCWTPLIVGITPNGAPTGFYEIRVWQHDLDGDLPYYSTRISLTSTAGEQSFWTYFIPEPIHEGLTNDNSTAAELAQRLRVTLNDSNGKELAQIPLATATARSVELPGFGGTPARGTRLVLMVGSGSTPALADYDPTRIVGIKEDLADVRLTPEQLPENVIGYDGVDAIVWLEGDPAQLNANGGQRFDALREYVRRGGHLVICTPALWQQVNGFDDLMPVDVTGVEINLLQSPLREMTSKVPFPYGIKGVPERNPWDAYHGALTIAVGTPRPGAVVDEYSNRIAEPLEAKDRTPWLVRRAYGFGCVTWVAQDLGYRELLDRANWGWPAVWEEVLGAESAPVVDPRMSDKRKYQAGSARDLGYTVLDAMNLSGRATILISVTILFFIAYWAVSGPGAFFWLRYKGRSTLNWFAFGALALLATAVTLGLVKLVLRGKPEVKHVSLARIDGDRVKPAEIVSRIGMYVPRDGAQHIEVSATAAASVPPTLTPFPIHPILHHKRDGDKYLFAAPREYRIAVPTDESARTAVADVPFRTTMKRLEANWSGTIDDRIEGTATLQPSVANVGYISGTLHNLTGKDLHNVYIAFRHEPPGGHPIDWMMYVADWKDGSDLDLGKAFNPPAGKTTQDITIDGDKRITPNADQPIRGWLSQWSDWFAKLPDLAPSTMGDAAPINDLDHAVPISIPLLSFYNRFPVITNENIGAGAFSTTRAEILRSGLRQWDVSNALMAGKLVIVAQVNDTKIPLPLSVEGEAITGTGSTIYQFVLPLAPIPETPTTKPATQPTTAAAK